MENRYDRLYDLPILAIAKYVTAEVCIFQALLLVESSLHNHQLFWLWSQRIRQA